jgi:hypothetical protein
MGITYGSDDAYNLVAGHSRKLKAWKVTTLSKFITVTNSTGLNFDKDLVASWKDNWHIDDLFQLERERTSNAPPGLLMAAALHNFNG